MKDAAVKQRKKAKDTLDFLKQVHRFATNPDRATRKAALLAVGPLLARTWPETLSVYREAMGDESEEVQAFVVKRLRMLRFELPGTVCLFTFICACQNRNGSTNTQNHARANIAC